MVDLIGPLEADGLLKEMGTERLHSMDEINDCLILNRAKVKTLWKGFLPAIARAAFGLQKR